MRGCEPPPPDVRALLPQRISQLGLRLEGSPVERYVQMLHRELEKKGLRHFRPPCYLTDEWGCPDGEPIIGIPFYLADPKLARLEKEIDDVEDAREIRMYLRHEAGHAFNYAYKLYESPEWRELFGPFNRPYRDRYRPVPFDRHFVRHLEGWYAQKHPDEDFGETFAVWLTPRPPRGPPPRSRGRDPPRGGPARRKPRYVDRMARAVGGTEPLVRLASTDITVEEMDMTGEEVFRAQQGEAAAGGAVGASIGEPPEPRDLWVEPRLEPAVLVELTAYATTLAMNHLARGSFVPRARRPLARAGAPRRQPAAGGRPPGAGGRRPPRGGAAEGRAGAWLGSASASPTRPTTRRGRRGGATARTTSRRSPASSGARATRSSSSAWSRRASAASRACAPTSSSTWSRASAATTPRSRSGGPPSHRPPRAP